MNARELIRILKDNGYRLDRQHGSHQIYENDAGNAVTVPVHGAKDLKIGTLKSILKQAGIKG